MGTRTSYADMLLGVLLLTAAPVGLHDGLVYTLPATPGWGVEGGRWPGGGW